MWDNVTIGKGVKGCSATKVFTIKGNHSISENSTSYWISDIYLGLGMTIFRDTEEGIRLTTLIQNEKPLEEINQFLINVLIMNIEVSLLKKAIDKALNQAFINGKNAKVRELQKVLSISYD